MAIRFNPNLPFEVQKLTFETHMVDQVEGIDATLEREDRVREIAVGNAAMFKDSDLNTERLIFRIASWLRQLPR